jgi:uncharacterized protein (DUF58 family)
MTSLFGNDVLAAVERLRLVSDRRFTARRQGEHRAGKGGSSTDFADYRDYAHGDDVRFVDWNIYARLRRPYMKVFHQEEESHLVLAVDASASMDFEGKLWRARQLAAAFGVMGLLNHERVSCWTWGGEHDEPAHALPGVGRAGMTPLFRFLEAIESGGRQPVEVGLESILKRHRGRGIIIILSDFLTAGDCTRCFNRCIGAGLDLYAVQILGPSEIDPSLESDVRLVDCETTEALDVTAAGRLLDLYQEYRASHERRLLQACRARGGRFLSLDAQADLRWTLLDQLPRKGWVR